MTRIPCVYGRDLISMSLYRCSWSAVFTAVLENAVAARSFGSLYRKVVAVRTYLWFLEEVGETGDVLRSPIPRGLRGKGRQPQPQD